MRLGSVKSRYIQAFQHALQEGVKCNLAEFSAIPVWSISEILPYPTWMKFSNARSSGYLSPTNTFETPRSLSPPCLWVPGGRGRIHLIRSPYDLEMLRSWLEVVPTWKRWKKKRFLGWVSWFSPKSDGFFQGVYYLLGHLVCTHFRIAKTVAPSFACHFSLRCLREDSYQVRWIRMPMTSCCSSAKIPKEGFQPFAELHCVWPFVRHFSFTAECWVLVGCFWCTKLHPPKQPWKDGRVPELYEPGLRLSLGAGTMHRNFSGQDVWNLVSQVSSKLWGVTRCHRLTSNFVSLEWRTQDWWYTICGWLCDHRHL